MFFNLPLGLVSLAIGAFGIGLTEFLIMGLLPEVAQAMNVSISQAGHFISAYAFGVVVGAPILTIVGRSLPPKKILIFLMIAFTIFNGLSAVAPNSNALLFFRFLSGLPHGAFFGVGGVVAARLVGPQKAGAAFAVMLSGLTICNIVGVPFATYVGHVSSWRIAFGLVSLIGVLTLTAISFWIPATEAQPKKKLSQEFVIFKNPVLWYIIAFASIGFGGFFAWFSYITPILTNLTRISVNHMPYLLSLAGMGMTFGNWFGGKLSESIPPLKASIVLTFLMAIVLMLNSIFVAYPIPMYFLTFLAGANAMAFVAPMQLLLLEAAKESQFLGSSIGQAAFNMGNSLGAFLGGLPLAAGYGLISPWWIGATLAFIGFLIILKLKTVAPKSMHGMAFVNSESPNH